MREPPCWTSHPLTLVSAIILAAALTTASPAFAACDVDFICGDGILVPQCEECDDGNTTSGDGCDANCLLESGGVCGDGNLDAGEECDDGNTTSGDGCSSTCTIECSTFDDDGDGFTSVGSCEGSANDCDDSDANVNPGAVEVCNGVDDDCDGAVDEGGVCAGACGNGVVEEGEECDDGNTANGDGCDANCMIEPAVCGNGVVESGEECDDGNTTNGDGCNANCLNESVCGNGSIDDGEECDLTELGGASCADIACSTGTVSCFAGCLLDYSGCTDCIVCSDDVCEAGENCMNCTTDCPILPFGAECGNGLCEAGDGENCINCPADCNGKQNGKPENRFCCGDGGGENPAVCPGLGRSDDPRCTSDGYACTGAPIGTGSTCCGDGICEAPEDGFSCELDCGAPPACVPQGASCNQDDDCCSLACNNGGKCK